MNNKRKRYNKNNTNLDITYISKLECSYQLSSDADNFNVSFQNQSDDHIISNLNIVNDNDDSSSELANAIIESEKEIDNLESNNKIENFESLNDNKYSESNSDDQIKNEDQNLQNFKEFKEELCA